MNLRPSLAAAILFIGVFGQPTHGCCPELWSRVGDYCVRYFGIEKTWEGARDHCLTFQVHSSDLVSIRSQAESTLIFDFWSTIVGDSSTEGKGYWIGANDRQSESNFKWSDGTFYIFTNWAYDEPNNLNGAEDCANVDIRGSNDIEQQKWNDAPCNSVTKPFFCQFKV